MTTEAVKKLSCNLQQIATALKEALEIAAGKEVNFILVSHVDDALQYISTVEREESMEILNELLERWKAHKADIPAHYNPDL